MEVGLVHFGLTVCYVVSCSEFCGDAGYAYVFISSQEPQEGLLLISSCNRPACLLNESLTHSLFKG